ncbi:hypothetical protein KSC_025600 [Ktedonobacter sp. SOSP1-52]|nr:hypothetical protein KSC_025600 [Ktedonobacter sp. SOSP1-52]
MALLSETIFVLKATGVTSALLVIPVVAFVLAADAGAAIPTSNSNAATMLRATIQALF